MAKRKTAKSKTAKKTRVGTLTDFAKSAKISKQMVSKLKAMGALKGALIDQPEKKRVLVNIDKALELYNERMDPNFRKQTRFRKTPVNKKRGMQIKKGRAGNRLLTQDQLANNTKRRN